MKNRFWYVIIHQVVYPRFVYILDYTTSFSFF
jgi:hypothetical protein